MITEVESLLGSYWRWLQDRTVLKEVGDCVEITTPYLDRHNDYIQIYAKRLEGGFLLSDDGYVIEDLEQSGCNINSARRRALLRTTIDGFGVRENRQALEVQASVDNFALQKHNLVQAMLAVNDMFYVAEASGATTLFHEDVAEWLDLYDIRYTPGVKFSGKSGYDHRFEFVIPKSRVQPERLLRAISRPRRETAEAVAFAWLDTREVRAPDSRAYALLNDTDKVVSENVVEAMRRYNVRAVPWSQREAVREDLAA